LINIACLAITEISEDNSQSGLLSIAGISLIYRQIHQLQSLGIERFIIAVDSMDAAILECADDLRRDGIDAQFIRSIHSITDVMNVNDRFLLFADSVWIDDHYINALLKEGGEKIYSLKTSPEYEKFERIDLNYRWSGLAILNASLITELQDLPEDSSLHSTLLRLALQKNIAVKNIEPEPIFRKIDSVVEVQSIQDEIIGAQLPERGFFEQYLLPKLLIHILRFLWRNEDWGMVLKFAPFASSLVSITCALFKLAFVSYGFAFLACFILFIQITYTQFDYRIKYYKMSEVLTLLNLYISAVLNQSDRMRLATIFPLIILFILGYSSKYLDFGKLHNRFSLSFTDIFFLIMVSSLFSIDNFAIMGLGIILSSWILIGVMFHNSARKR